MRVANGLLQPRTPGWAALTMGVSCMRLLFVFKHSPGSIKSSTHVADPMLSCPGACGARASTRNLVSLATQTPEGL